TFILAFAQGAATAWKGTAGLIDAFGVIATVALIPILAVQLLGIIATRPKKRPSPVISPEAKER
ncbi:MAG: DUF1538 family protein, partial [Peptococcus niger]